MSARCVRCGGTADSTFAYAPGADAMRAGATCCDAVGGTVYGCVDGFDVVEEESLQAIIDADPTGEIAQILPHIQRGEVCMVGGGAGPLGCVWMDTTGDGTDILTAARAFAIARGEEAR